MSRVFSWMVKHLGRDEWFLLLVIVGIVLIGLGYVVIDAVS